MNALVGNELMPTTLRFKIRLDFKGLSKPGRLFFGGKNTEKVAEELREQQVGLLRNVPLQGVSIEDIDMSMDVYTVYDEIINTDVAYAPVIIKVRAESLDDIMRFLARDEFRKVEILEPEQVVFSKLELERLLFRMNEEIKNFGLYLERKYSNR